MNIIRLLVVAVIFAATVAGATVCLREMLIGVLAVSMCNYLSLGYALFMMILFPVLVIRILS